MRTAVDRILVHEDRQPAAVRDFIAQHMSAMGNGAPAAEVHGEVPARIDNGRWIVDCPEKCGGAIVPSLEDPVFACPDCGSPGNGGRFYRVVFPGEREEIEKVLLLRPSRRVAPGLGSHRFWNVGETAEELKDQNVNMGCATGDGVEADAARRVRLEKGKPEVKR